MIARAEEGESCACPLMVAYLLQPNEQLLFIRRFSTGWRIVLRAFPSFISSCICFAGSSRLFLCLSSLRAYVLVDHAQICIHEPPHEEQEVEEAKVAWAVRSSRSVLHFGIQVKLLLACQGHAQGSYQSSHAILAEEEVPCHLALLF